jgi:hypothetical protein
MDCTLWTKRQRFNPIQVLTEPDMSDFSTLKSELETKLADKHQDFPGFGR